MHVKVSETSLWGRMIDAARLSNFDRLMFLFSFLLLIFFSGENHAWVLSTLYPKLALSHPILSSICSFISGRCWQRKECDKHNLQNSWNHVSNYVVHALQIWLHNGTKVTKEKCSFQLKFESSSESIGFVIPL